MNEKEITRIIEYTEADAYADLFHAAPPDFAAQLGLRVEKIGSATALIMAGADIPLFNRVMGLGVDAPATEEMVDHIVAIYKDAGVRGMVQLAPSVESEEVVGWLEARGFARRDNWVKVIRGPEPPPHVDTDLRIERIGLARSEDHAEVALVAFGMPQEFKALLQSGVGRPGWTHYLALDGDQPVATAMLFIQGQTAWFGGGSTLPTHRKRGGQGALFAARIEDAIAAGCKWLITETWEEHPPESVNPSYHNMLRMGFELVYARGNYILGTT